MPDASFEAWLALLTRFLRLSPKQREEIRRELRSHLEDAIESEMARGASREQAILKVLEDFGDAAELAHRFRHTHAARRWIMQGTLAAACLAILAIGTSLIVPHSAHPVQAQQNAAPPKDGATRVVPAASDEFLEDALDKILPEASFQEAPLEALLAWLGDQSGLNIVVLWNALQDFGINPDHTMTLNFKKVSTRTALALIFADLRTSAELSYDMLDSTLVIAPGDRFRMVVRVYDVADLLAADQAEPAAEAEEVSAHAASLVELVTDTAYPESWEQNGGEGTIRVFKHKLVARNYGWAHREIRELLRQLRNSEAPH
jgi:hypothetical protein